MADTAASARRSRDGRSSPHHVPPAAGEHGLVPGAGKVVDVRTGTITAPAADCAGTPSERPPSGSHRAIRTSPRRDRRAPRARQLGGSGVGHHGGERPARVMCGSTGRRGRRRPRPRRRERRGRGARGRRPIADCRCPPGAPARAPSNSISNPPVVTKRRRRPSSTRAAATEAATSSARSKESPRWAPARVSSRTVATSPKRSSSWRSMRSPSRAVERQWTRRRSSPTSYSRRAKKSSPRAARAGWVAPWRASRVGEPGRASTGWIRGCTTSRAGTGELRAPLGQPERVADPEHQRADRDRPPAARWAGRRRPPPSPPGASGGTGSARTHAMRGRPATGIGGHRRAGRPGTDVREPQSGGGGGTGAHPGRRQPALAPVRQRRPPDDHGRPGHRHRGGGAEPGQFDRPEQAGQDQQTGGGQRGGRSPGG